MQQLLRRLGWSTHGGVGCRGWNEAEQVARLGDGKIWKAVLKNLDSMMKTYQNVIKGLPVDHLGFWDLVSEQVPISRKVTVLAGRIKVNPNFIHLFGSSRSPSPYLKLQFAAVLCFSLLSHPVRNDFPLYLKRVTKTYSSEVVGVVKRTLQSETSNAMTSPPIASRDTRWKLSRES